MSCARPHHVKDIGAVGQVACGGGHTIALSQDGKTVWSFGSGDDGLPFDMHFCRWVYGHTCMLFPVLIGSHQCCTVACFIYQ